MKGKVFVFSAPSGAGKSSLISALVEQDPRFSVSISHTTRPMRKGELDKQHYYFVDDEKFDKMVSESGLAEWAHVFSYKYGTARSTINKLLESGQNVLLDIDWQGAAQIKGLYPDAVLIYIIPPSLEHLRKRLVLRGDKKDSIENRMQQAESELSHQGEYDYIIVNDDFDKCLEQIKGVI